MLLQGILLSWVCIWYFWLIEISSAYQSLLCQNEMVVLSPILRKILITNTSALLVEQNKFYWTVMGNVLYMSGTQISIVLTVSKAHSLQQKSYQFSLNAFCWVCIWFETSSASQSLFGHEGMVLWHFPKMGHVFWGLPWLIPYLVLLNQVFDHLIT